MEVRHPGIKWEVHLRRSTYGPAPGGPAISSGYHEGSGRSLPILAAMDIASLRKSYEKAELDETASDADPLRQFQRWFDEAVSAQVPEPNAMSLAMSRFGA